MRTVWRRRRTACVHTLKSEFFAQREVLLLEVSHESLLSLIAVGAATCSVLNRGAGTADGLG